MCESLGSTQSIPIMTSTTQATSQPSALKTAIATLYHSGKYSDLTLECDGLRFKVHKSVVCGRSPVLEKECDGNFLEGKTGYVVVGAPDANRYTVRRMLDYLYKDDYNDCEPYSSIGFIAGASEEVHPSDLTDKKRSTEAKVSLKFSKKDESESLASSIGSVQQAPAGSLMGSTGPSIFGGSKSPRAVTDPKNLFAGVNSDQASENPTHTAMTSNNFSNAQSLFAPLRSASLPTGLASMVQSTSSPQPQPSPNSNSNYFSKCRILNNVHVYALANYYQIIDLKHIAAAKFARALIESSVLPKDMVVAIIREVYGITDVSSTLRFTLVDNVARKMDPKDTGWVETLTDVPEFVVETFRRRISFDANIIQSQKKSIGKVAETIEAARLRVITDVLAHDHCAGALVSEVAIIPVPTGGRMLDSSSDAVNVSAAQEKQANTRLKCRKCGKVIAEAHVTANRS